MFKVAGLRFTDDVLQIAKNVLFGDPSWRQKKNKKKTVLFPIPTRRRAFPPVWVLDGMVLR